MPAVACQHATMNRAFSAPFGGVTSSSALPEALMKLRRWRATLCPVDPPPMLASSAFGRGRLMIISAGGIPGSNVVGGGDAAATTMGVRG